MRDTGLRDRTLSDPLQTDYFAKEKLPMAACLLKTFTFK